MSSVLAESRLVAPVLEAVRQEVRRRRLTADEVARRAGLSSARTVQRLLSGTHLSLSTLEAVADALGVPVDDRSRLRAEVAELVRQEVGTLLRQDRANRTKMPMDAQRHVGPVVSWSEAARLLGVSRNRLGAEKKRARVKRRPWWRDVEALYDWYEGLE